MSMICYNQLMKNTKITKNKPIDFVELVVKDYGNTIRKLSKN